MAVGCRWALLWRGSCKKEIGNSMEDDLAAKLAAAHTVEFNSRVESKHCVVKSCNPQPFRDRNIFLLL